MRFLTNFNAKQAADYAKAIRCYTGPEVFWICGDATYGDPHYPIHAKDLMALYVEIKDEALLDLSNFWTVFDAIKGQYSFEAPERFNIRKGQARKIIANSNYSFVDKREFEKHQ